MPENDHDVAAPSRNDHDVDRNKARRSMRWWMPQNWPDAPTWPTGMPHSCPPPLCQVAIQIQIQRKIRRRTKMINKGGLTKLRLFVQSKADASTSNNQQVLLWCCLNPTHYCLILKRKKSKSIFVPKAFICAMASYEGKVKLLLIVELQKGISAWAQFDFWYSFHCNWPPARWSSSSLFLFLFFILCYFLICAF